jgi:SAM-dependent methyltransferase
VYAKELAEAGDIYVDGYLKGESELGFGLDIFHPYFQAFLGFAADVRMRRLARYARPPGRLLDVGCGSGEVVQGAMRQGWTAMGVEPVEESAKIAQDRGLDVREGMLDEVGLDPGSFEAVTAFHVLEHMEHATDLLRSMARYAVPGVGLVAVEVPNLRSAHRFGSGAEWPGLRPLEHLCHFTPATLRSTFERAGLVDVAVGTIGFLWPGETLPEALHNLGLGRFLGRLRRFAHDGEVIGRRGLVPDRASWKALRAVESTLDVAKLGAAIFAVGRVPS